MDVTSEIADMREDIGMIKAKLDNAIILTISPKVMAGLLIVGSGGLYIGVV